MHKPKKPKVIEIPIQKQEAAQEILDDRFASRDHTRINELAGLCCICGEIAQLLLKYDVSDDDDDDGHKIYRVERYCQSCYQRWVVECKDKVLLTATNGKDKTIAVVEK